MIKLFGHETDGVIFDLDGTLLDSMWVWNKVDEDFLAENGIAVTSDYTEAVKQMHFNEAALYTKNRYNLPQSTQQIKDRWIEMVEKEYAEEIWNIQPCPVAVKSGSGDLIEDAANNAADREY